MSSAPTNATHAGCHGLPRNPCVPASAHGLQEARAPQARAMRRPATGASTGIDTLQHLVERLAEFMAPSTAIVCVGNELCGDDGAGRGASPAGSAATSLGDVYCVETVPESFLMKIVERRPDVVLLVDALGLPSPAGRRGLGRGGPASAAWGRARTGRPPWRSWTSWR